MVTTNPDRIWAYSHRDGDLRAETSLDLAEQDRAEYGCDPAPVAEYVLASVAESYLGTARSMRADRDAKEAERDALRRERDALAEHLERTSEALKSASIIHGMTSGHLAIYRAAKAALAAAKGVG